MRCFLFVIGALCFGVWSPGVAVAHEGHDPLPTKGAAVKGDRLILSASAAKAIGLRTAKIELAEVRRTVRATCSVELPWTQKAYVTSLIAGRVEQVLVKPGEAVAAGQELARISGAELETLQLAMLQATTDKLLAQRILQGQESAGAGISGKVLLQTRTEVQQQTARFNTAWQKLRALGLSSETLQHICDSRQTLPAISLVSPIRGIVAVAGARAGQIVRPAEHLYHIVDPSRVWIVGRVLEADAGQVKRGLSVEASFAMLPEVRFQAEIDHVDLRLEPDRTLSVKASLENPSGALKPGMFGRMEIELTSNKAVVCPTEALIRDGQATDALVEDSAANYLRKKVTVAAVRGGRAEIDDGLFPGDRVVTVGSHELAALFPKRSEPNSVLSARQSEGIIAQGQVELPIDQKTFASAPIDGRIQRILVEHGQRVRKDQVLAEVESLPFKTLQLDFLQAHTSLAQASLNLARAEALGETLARKELWQLQTLYDTFQQSTASLRRQLSVAGLSESEIAAIEKADLTGTLEDLPAALPIRAPADGLIGDFDLIPGQFVAQKTQLFELHNPSKVWIRAFVFEQDAVHVSTGQAVEVRLASDPKFRMKARVDRLDPLLFAGNRALSIWTELDNPGLKLKEGMAATVTIQTSHTNLLAE